MPTHFSSIRTAARSLALSVLGRCARARPGVRILSGHYVGREVTSVYVFEAFIQMLSHRASFCTVSEAVAELRSGSRLREPVVAFTFDDGFEECYSHIAPVLRSFGVNACFFVCPGFIDGSDAYRTEIHQERFGIQKPPMRWEMLRHLANNGFDIGSHTIDHLRLSSIEPAELKRQIVESRHRIEAQTGHVCRYFAFPYGRMCDVNEQALVLADQKYQAVFSGARGGTRMSACGRVIHRCHIEPNWPTSHVQYFLAN